MLLWSYGALANGGDQRIVENKYFINMSRAPFTPRAEEKTSFLISFARIDTMLPIAEDLIVKIRIAKLGEVGTEGRTFLFEKDNIPVKSGVLEFPYTFTETGLHEIFIDFAFASNQQKIYETPDFLLDVQKPLNGYNTSQILMAIVGSFVIGLSIGWFIKKIMSSKVGNF